MKSNILIQSDSFWLFHSKAIIAMKLRISSKQIQMAFDDIWVNNSIPITFPAGNFTNLLFVLLAFSSLVLCQSFVVNWNKRLDRKVRICTELVAVALIGQVLCSLLCASCNKRNSSYVMDVLSNGIFSFTNTICDNYIVFNRYETVKMKISMRHKIAAASFFLFFIIIPWWPFFTFVPYFANMNSDISIEYRKILLIFSFCAEVLFEGWYTLLMIFELSHSTQRVATNVNNSKKFDILAMKSILHNILSIIGSATVSFWFPFGLILKNFITLATLHFLFNWKIENYCLNDKKLNNISSSSTSRKSTLTSRRLQWTKEIITKQLSSVPFRSVRDLNNENTIREAKNVKRTSFHRNSIKVNESNIKCNGIGLQ